MSKEAPSRGISRQQKKLGKSKQKNNHTKSNDGQAAHSLRSYNSYHIHHLDAVDKFSMFSALSRSRSLSVWLAMKGCHHGHVWSHR